ncbi:DNA primase regulatory subunit PriL [Halorhabdus sp. CUG00001]|uniref:DNA primase regulatory subunit PriL n=1 Tax=Halorhabdus sp. CUG00001 TaxID=2600297 RepID=UPI00131C2D57|nr:DNA primase regulatory subunit PriL [Halorhabdus sp. CUG00001]
MEPRHARYPFLGSAREAVEAADVDLVTVAREGGPAVDRGRERILSGLFEGTVGQTHRRPRVELLSYPVARVLVSLVDQPALTHRYARAEAATAHERFQEDLTATSFRSTDGQQLTLGTLLAEFDLRGAVEPVGTTGLDDADRFSVAVGTYLELAAGEYGDDWRLVNRSLADGRVPIDREELLELLRAAVEERVLEGLPLNVPEPIAEGLTEDVETISERLDELDLTREIDTVVPELFPPCMTALLDQIQKGEHLAHHSRFAITSFLTSIGMTTDDIVDLYEMNPGFGEEMTRYQTDHIRGETSPTEYSPPACATMQSYGDCVNMDDLCEEISHPLSYYEAKLEDTDEDEVVDWREREAAE